MRDKVEELSAAGLINRIGTTLNCVHASQRVLDQPDTKWEGVRGPGVPPGETERDGLRRAATAKAKSREHLKRYLLELVPIRAEVERRGWYLPVWDWEYER